MKIDWVEAIRRIVMLNPELKDFAATEIASCKKRPNDVVLKRFLK